VKTPSVLQFFKARPKGQATSESTPTPVPTRLLCQHLNGPEYESYISLTHTRQYGGISLILIAKIARCLFPYKDLAALDGNNTDWKDIQDRIATVFPPTDSEGEYRINNSSAMNKWTKHEKKTFQTVLRPWVRWEVDYVNGSVRASNCERETTNSDGRCDACRTVAKDKALQHAIRKVGFFFLRLLVIRI